LIVYWVGLVNTIYAPILVITALELPFFIFIMKGFFDAVPWDIEMSAMTDGASRRQAFRMVILPQVRVGLIAVGVFAFIKGWEEYVFVTGLTTGQSYTVMSTYLYYVSEDVMGVDYGIVAAVAVLYLLPALLLYLACQKYLTQMTLGGVKG
jgi:inositol-phosphate transport system permease protein